ncbi:MAG: hypothetical protein LBF83_00390 [Spirochaetaceae bacterium]|nr:hypothetical protein [Spirochaetaceae bacterium]
MVSGSENHHKKKFIFGWEFFKIPVYLAENTLFSKRITHYSHTPALLSSKFRRQISAASALPESALPEGFPMRWEILPT